MRVRECVWPRGDTVTRTAQPAWPHVRYPRVELQCAVSCDWTRGSWGVATPSDRMPHSRGHGRPPTGMLSILLSVLSGTNGVGAPKTRSLQEVWLAYREKPYFNKWLECAHATRPRTAHRYSTPHALLSREPDLLTKNATHARLIVIGTPVGHRIFRATQVCRSLSNALAGAAGGRDDATDA